jgi:hypothetical protein
VREVIVWIFRCVGQTSRRTTAAITTLALAVAVSTATAAEVAPPDSASLLVIAYQASLEGRPRLLQLLASEQSHRFAQWRKNGVLERYQLLVNRYTDEGTWDAMAILTFRDADQLARWHQIERTAPGGLEGAALKLTRSIQTAPVDLFRSAAAPRPRGHSVFAVIPYDYLVSLSDYEKYIDAYVIPQTQGWIDEQALQSYSFYLARYPAARPWSALLVLEYTDDTALSRRSTVTAKVRERLANIPSWKAISDNKQSVRTEGRLVVADDVTRSPPLEGRPP